MTGGTLPCEPTRQVTRWPVHAEDARAPAQMDLCLDGPCEGWGVGGGAVLTHRAQGQPEAWEPEEQQLES